MEFILFIGLLVGEEVGGNNGDELSATLKHRVLGEEEEDEGGNECSLSSFSNAPPFEGRGSSTI